MKRYSILAAVTAVLILLACGSPAAAITATTTVTAARTTPADWNTPANWDTNDVPDVTGDTAIIPDNQTDLRIITFSQPNTTIGHLQIINSKNNGTSTATSKANQIGVLSDTAHTLTFDAAGSGPATLTVSGASTGSVTPNNIFGAVVLNDDLVVDVAWSPNTSAAGAFTFRQGEISGPGGITKNGNGYLTFADAPAKTYTGPTIINSGRLRINGATVINGTSSITVNPGGQFVLDGAADWTFGSSTDTPVILNGFGLNTEVYGANPIGNFPGAIRTGTGLLAAIENKIVLASDASINVVSTNPVTTPGKLNLFNEISGPGRLVANQKAGSISREGFLYLAHSNTYTGGTTLEQGTLTVSDFLGTHDANLGTGNVFVDGSAPATDGNVDGASSGKLVIETGITNAIADNAYLYLTGGGTAGVADRGFLTLGAGVNEVVGRLIVGGVNGAGVKVLGAGTYGIGAANPGLANPEEYFSGTGTLTVTTPAHLLVGDFDDNGVVDAGDYITWRKGGPLANDVTPGYQAADFNEWRAQFDATTNPASGSSLTGSAVPEPTSIALTGCLVSLVALGRRRKVYSSCSAR